MVDAICCKSTCTFQAVGRVDSFLDEGDDAWVVSTSTEDANVRKEISHWG